MGLVFVLRFCSEFLKNNVPMPSELVTGYSSTLLDGVSLAFNNCTFSQYNAKCYDYMMQYTSALPPVVVQVDTVSIIKVIEGSQCFDEKSEPVKKFLLLSIIYLSSTDKFTKFEETAISLLTLILSPYENDSTESKRLTLLSNIRNEDIKAKYEKYVKYSSDPIAHRSFSHLTFDKAAIFDNCSKTMVDYANYLQLQARKIYESADNSRKEANAYYCPEWINSNLHALLTQFPSWTSIIRGHSNTFSLATSCAMQHSVTLKELDQPISASKFVPYHVERVKSLAQKGRAFVNESKSKGRNVKKVASVNIHNCLNDQENWMGRNEWQADDAVDDDECIPSSSDGVLVAVSSQDIGVGRHPAKESSPTDSIFKPSASLETNHQTHKIGAEIVSNCADGVHTTVSVREKEACQHATEESASLDNIIQTFTKHNKSGSNNGVENDMNTSTNTLDNLPEIICLKPEDEQSMQTDQYRPTDSIFKPSTSLETKQQIHKIGAEIVSNCADGVHTTVSVREEEACQHATEESASLDNIIQTLTEHNESGSNNGVENDMNTSTNTLDNLPEIILLKPEDEQSMQTDESIEFSNNVLAHSTPLEINDCYSWDLLMQNISREHNYSMKTDECSKNNLLSQNISMEHNYSLGPKTTKDCNLDDKKSILENRALVNSRKKKYVTPFPAMKIYHEQAPCKSKLKETIIRNGNCLKPRKVSGKLYVFNDTSTVDTLFEVMAFAYKNIKDFRVFVDTQTCKFKRKGILFSQIVIDYCKSGNMASFYKSRALLLFEYGETRGDTISCGDRVGSVFSKIMIELPSYKKTVHCSHCDAAYDQYETKIELAIPMIKNLQEELQNYFQEKKHYCRECEITVAASYGFGSYLMIDIQQAKVAEFLNMVPEYIHLNHNRYILVSIIGFESSDARHYIAYCRSIRNSWSSKNNIVKRVKHLRKLPKITIALILYVRINATS